ncbi:MAG: ABC transporter ATP-binding protein [Chitinispirillaceae bacterium]
MAYIDVKNVSRSFGGNSILQDVSLQIEKGSIYGLVGLNGAGKTTLIRILLGLLKKGGGELTIGGFDPWRHETDFYRRAGVVLENDGFWGNMTVRDNLRIFAAAKKISWNETQKYFSEYWGDSEIFSTDRKVKFLSRGQKMQCGLCRAYLGWPDVCVLDEPVVSLDLKAYEHFKAIAREARSRGAVQLISSHQLETIDDLCDRVGLLRNGRIEELDHGGAKQSWVIKVLSEGQWDKIVTEQNVEDVEVHEGVIRFSVTDVEESIPRIVEALVMAGCRISEVRPSKQEFSDTIRNIYSDKH